MKKNTPYVKKYENGILINPITKDKPYLNSPSVHFKKIFEESQISMNRFWQLSLNKFFKGKSIVRA